MGRHALANLLFLGLLAASPVALTADEQPVPTDAADRAAALQRKGADLQGRGDYAGALQAYRDSQAVAPSPQVAERVRKLEAYLAAGARGPAPVAATPPASATPSPAPVPPKASAAASTVPPAARALMAAMIFREAASLGFANAVQPADRAAAFSTLLQSADYRRDPYTWTHFFGGTLVLLGHAADRRLVTAFYNPYYDTAVLASWNVEDVAPRMVGAVVVSGRQFRSEGAPKDAWLPEWLATPAAMSRSLPRQVAAFQSAFERRYPPQALTAGPEDLPADDAAARSRVQQLGAIQIAALVALHDRVLPDLTAADLALRTALARGDEPALGAMVPPESPASAELLLRLPLSLRATLLPSVVLPGKGLVLVVLVSPAVPRFGVAVFYQSAPAVRIRHVAVVDLLAGGGK
jgi:hypothetical protein